MAQFTVTRSKAAKVLWVSTRTVDRYVKSWRISYKKISNRVLLSQEDVQDLKQELSITSQGHSSEIVNESSVSNTKHTNTIKLEKMIDEKIDKFFLIFQEKDQILEEKNKVVFMLQQRITELETKISKMIALPDYNEEKQLAKIEKEKLEEKIKQLSHTVRGEKTKNTFFLVVLIVLVISIVFRYFVVLKGGVEL